VRKRYGQLTAKKRVKTAKKVHQPTSKKEVLRYSPKGKHLLAHNASRLAGEMGVTSASEYTGDAVSRYDRPTLVAMTRQLDDENMVYATIFDRLCSNLLGPNGFTLQARTGSDAVNQIIENELWPAFTASPEYRDLFSWKDCQYLTMRDMIGVGDIGFIKLKNGQLQAIENERINTPSGNQIKNLPNGRKVEQGIEMTKAGRVLAYWITEPNRWGFQAAAKGHRVDKKNFIYCHGKAQRFSRSRPIPPFIQVASSTFRLDDILNSEAIAWQLLSKHAVIVTQAAASETGYDLSVDDEQTENVEGTVTDRVTESEAGIFFWGEEGEEVRGVDRNLPGKDFPASVRSFLQLFAMRIGLPLEILMLDWTKTNFASGKGALVQASQNIREWQVRIVEQLHQQVYEWKVRQWIDDDLIPEFDTVANHEWFPPVPPWVDPIEQAKSWGIQVAQGQVTYSNMLKQNGKDRDTQIEERKQDYQAAITAADELMKANPGVQISWKPFAGLEEGKTEAAFNGNNTENSGENDNEA
jgi:capsid protein